MGKIFYAADLHFGHKGILKERPQFSDLQEMNQTLLHAWRERVTPADTVYILGDLFAYRYDPDLVRRLTGNLILICGNHEEQHWLSHADLPGYIRVIHGEAECMDQGRQVKMAHIPRPDLYRPDEKNTYVLYGHLHNNEPRDPAWREFCLRRRALNAGVDICFRAAGKYMPAALDELIIYNDIWSTLAPWLKEREK